MSVQKTIFAVFAVFAVCVGLSAVHPWGNPRSGIEPGAPLLQGSVVPDDVRHVLATKCGDCHSENTHYPIYSRIAPASWLLERDVHEGRSHLDLSQWQHYSLESQNDLLTRIASEARSGGMPVKQYLLIHPQARLSTDEQELLYLWARTERKRIKQQMAASQQSPSAH